MHPVPEKIPAPQWKIALLLGTLTAFGPLSIDMYLPAFPVIVSDLSAPEGEIQLTLAVFLMGAALGQLIYGPLADRWGRRLPLLWGCGIFIAGALACAWAATAEWLIAARLLQALGGGSGLVIARAVVRDLYEERDAARMFSLLMLVMGLAPILAPLMGSQVLLFGGWRFIFLLLVVFGVFCMVAVWRWLPETLPVERRSAAGLGVVGSHYATLLSHRHFLGYALVAGCVSGSLFSYISGAPFLFIELHGVSPREFSLFFGANATGLIAAAQVNRLLLKHFRPETILSGALLANAAGGTALAVCGVAGWGGLPLMAFLLFVCLSSIGFTFPNVAAAALAPFGNMAGAASALLGTVQFMIGGFAGALVGLLNDGTAVPMTVTVAVFAVLAFFALGLTHFSSGRG